jgi:hypothetical protein
MPGCADVCLDHGYEGWNEFFVQKVVKARKQHKCVECRRGIKIGERYENSSGKYDDCFFRDHTCLICAEIREAFVCGSFTFGELYPSIKEVMFPVWEESGPIDCLAKVESLEARNFLRDLYAEYRREGG